MSHSKIIPRREFITLAACGVGGALVARAAEPKPSRIVSLRDAHIGTLEIDLRIMNQYKTQPQGLLDFYVACREALTGENPESDLAAVCRKFGRKKLGGPMLGDLKPESVALWMHLPEPDRIKVVVTPEGGGKSRRFKSNGKERIFSVRCKRLSPDTTYAYKVTNSKNEDLGEGRFVTPLVELSEKPFKIAFGTCYHKVGMYRPELMKSIRERDNRAMLILGDSAVDGRRARYGLVNSDYMLRNLSTPWQQMTANVPVSATWDDHDYWGDDTGGRTDRQGRPIDVDGIRQSWRSQWNNPQRDSERDGIYFHTNIGPVHYIALDTRSCRVNEQRGKLNSFLGLEQMDWLKQQIKESTSPFILISGGTMWSDNISAGKDSWGTWDTEGREEVFRMIDEKKDSKVILLSGDRHGARGLAIPRPNGGKIHEFEVACMGGVPGPKGYGKNPEDQLFGYPGRTWAFGEFTFKLNKGTPEAIFHLIGEKGEEMETVVLG